MKKTTLLPIFAALLATICIGICGYIGSIHAGMPLAPSAASRLAVGVPTQQGGYSSAGQGFCTSGTSTTTPVQLTATSTPCALAWIETSGGTAAGVGTIGTSSTAAGPILVGSATYTAVPIGDVSTLYFNSSGGTLAKCNFLYFVP